MIAQRQVLTSGSQAIAAEDRKDFNNNSVSQRLCVMFVGVWQIKAFCCQTVGEKLYMPCFLPNAKWLWKILQESISDFCLSPGFHNNSDNKPFIPCIGRAVETVTDIFNCRGHLRCLCQLPRPLLRTLQGRKSHRTTGLRGRRVTQLSLATGAGRKSAPRPSPSGACQCPLVFGAVRHR